ncbi:MAG: hypothetical protein HON90_06925 [Halobacteriovoraceae bacterium]|jgi:uncharacterized protein|nr:hypothetical protein [Halobacteriovoraceae bacterium]
MKKLFLALLFTLLVVSCGKKIEDSDKTPPRPPINEPGVTKTDSTIDQEQKRRLLNAINANDLNLVNTELKKSVHIDYHFTNGETPLTMAIQKAKPQIITTIINKVLAPNLKNKMGVAPLHLLVKTNNFSNLKTIIRLKSIDIDIHDKDGNSPLALAVDYKNQNMAIKLLTYGADFNIKIQKGIRLNALPSEYNFKKFNNLIRLIESHPFVATENFILAIKTGNIYFTDYLLNKFPEYYNDIRLKNVLNDAIDIENKLYQTRMLARLLRRGANPNITNDPEPPLIYAVKKAQKNLLNILFSYGAKVNVYDQNNHSPLYYASKNLHYYMAKKIKEKLLSRNANISRDERKKILKQACRVAGSVNENGLYESNSTISTYDMKKMLGCYSL